MSREKDFEVLQGKLREDHIFACRDELENFLCEDVDEFTAQLQDAIDEKLENPGFHHQYFADFLNEYQQNNPSDESGYSTMRSEIYGEEEELGNQEDRNKPFVNGRVGKWIDAYLSNEIDDKAFSYLIVLEKLFCKKIPLEVKEIIDTAIKCLVSNKHLTTKQEQEIKNTLNEAKKAYLGGDYDGVVSAMEKITDVLK